MQRETASHPDSTSRPSTENEASSVYGNTCPTWSDSTLITTESNDEASRCTNSATLKELFGQLLDAFGTLSRLRNKHMLLQAQTSSEASNYQHKRTFAEQSVLQLIETFSKQKWEGIKATPERAFDEVKAQMIGDGAALQSQSQTLMDVESRSSSLQFHVDNAEKHFMGTLKQVVHHMPNGVSLWLEMETAAKEKMDQVSEASDEIPEPAQTFFNAAGRINIIKEQLIDLLQQHIDEKATRDFMRDHDDEPGTPDAEVDDRHRTAEEMLRVQLSEAVRITEEAKRVCEADGIDLEALRHQHVSDTDNSEEPQTPRVAALLFTDSMKLDLVPNGSPLFDTTNGNDEEATQQSARTVQNWLFGPELRPETNEAKLREGPFVTRRETLRKNSGHPLRRNKSDSMLIFDG